MGNKKGQKGQYHLFKIKHNRSTNVSSLISNLLKQLQEAWSSN
jgi:hypothetical protein